MGSDPHSAWMKYVVCSTTSGDIFYCSGSRQLNHSSFYYYQSTAITRASMVTRILAILGLVFSFEFYSTDNTLEVRGRARREAARRHKSEWKVNFGSRNSSRSNSRCRMTTKTVSYNQILNFHDYFFWGWGTPVPVEVCPSKPRSIYSTCKNLRAQHPLRGCPVSG